MVRSADSDQIRTVELDMPHAALSKIILGVGLVDELLVTRKSIPLLRIPPAINPNAKFGNWVGLLKTTNIDESPLINFAMNGSIEYDDLDIGKMKPLLHDSEWTMMR